MPEMHSVESSSIEAIGYDEESMELHVRFLGSGATYVYQNVPREAFDGLMMADSKGTYLSREVRNRYEFHRL